MNIVARTRLVSSSAVRDFAVLIRASEPGPASRKVTKLADLVCGGSLRKDGGGSRGRGGVVGDEAAGFG
jgi:hypothetical protein